MSRANTKTHIKRILNECMHIHGKYPKLLIADNAREFVGKDITSECESLGIKLQPIVPHHPQENSINERVHRTIYEAARAALSHERMTSKHWDAAVLDATYKYNNIPHSSTGNIPHHTWHHSSRAFRHFIPFGQYGTTVNGLVTTKLSPRSEAVQYLYPSDHDHIIVENISTRSQHKVRANDFKIYSKKLDPSAIPLWCNRSSWH